MTIRLAFLIGLVSFTGGLLVASFAGFRDFIPGLLTGAWVTVQITALAAILAVVAAMAAGLAKLSSIRILRWIANIYVEIFRGTSALVQLFWLYFVLPHFGISLSAMTVAVLGLGLNVGAYGAEVVRGSIQAVAKGQYEAAKALNMSRSLTMRRIIIPQAIAAMLPPWGNLFIELLKATALVSLITITDLTFRAYQLNQVTLRTVEIFTLVLVVYLALSLVITIGMRALERRVGADFGTGRVL